MIFNRLLRDSIEHDLQARCRELFVGYLANVISQASQVWLSSMQRQGCSMSSTPTAFPSMDPSPMYIDDSVNITQFP